ncbi:class I SAM-dependent methyltransferase, partial [Candidatus Bipolaricaulota bacterium]|nr:class I SAM-dependent methyltransferase [Candidatus Bipolaricaulota bacterium]
MTGRSTNGSRDLAGAAAYEYSEQFVGADAVAGYLRKFNRKVDRIRHRMEVRILDRHVSGDCFDCSVGTGRFISELASVRSYSGMDYSPDLAQYARTAYPSIRVEHGDLMKGIDAPDETYDTVFCIRTLFALQGVEGIVREMARIARPGGRVIFDYGADHLTVEIDGREIETSATDIRRTADIISEKLAGASTFFLVVDGKTESSMKQPDLLKAVDSIQSHMEGLPGVDKTVSIVGHLKQLHSSLNYDDPDSLKVPDNQGIIEEELLL